MANQDQDHALHDAAPVLKALDPSSHPVALARALFSLALLPLVPMFFGLALLPLVLILLVVGTAIKCYFAVLEGWRKLARRIGLRLPS